MVILFIVSLIWGFSFGLIKNALAGVDPYFVAAVRLGLSLLVFLPFYRPGSIDRRVSFKLAFMGAIQYGLMYIAYLYSFKYLKAYEVALFTIFTPLYVTLFWNAMQHHFNFLNMGTTLLAIAGTWIVQGGGMPKPGFLTGFFIVQISNLCFAFGQIYYRQVLKGRKVEEGKLFALPYLGGFLTSGIAALVFADRNALSLNAPQWFSLVYLGVIASGLCFFLWNVGARRVDAGTLAIFNDLKIPTAVAVSLIVFGEKTNMLHLLLGGGIILGALILNESKTRSRLLKDKAGESRPAA